MVKTTFRLILICLTVASLAELNYAQDQVTTAVPFLEIAPDSRGGSIGESGTGLADNSAAIFWNPAGLAFQTGTELSITHSNWLPQFNLDLFYDYFTYKEYFKELQGTVSSSITYMNYGEFVRTGENPAPGGGPEVLGTFKSFDAAVTVGYATKVSPDWGLGFNFRLIHSHLSDQGAGEEQGSGVATSVSFDVGSMWRPAKLIIPFTNDDIGNRFSVGVDLSNLGPKIYYIDQAQADPIPTNFRLGFAYEVFDDQFNSLNYTLDFSKLLVREIPGDTTLGTAPQSDPFYKAIFTSWTAAPFSQELRSIQTSMGLEYWYGIPGDFQFALRTGFFYEDPDYGDRKFISFGAGIRYDIYGFDFSYISTDIFKGQENSPLSNTLRFSLIVAWGGVNQNTPGFPRGI
jgi:Type IX secretion system protein PorV